MAEGRSGLGQAAAQLAAMATTVGLGLVGGLLTGTIMFAEWEQWNYLDSTYFCVISLLKIGLGDFVPGTSTLVNDVGQRQMNNVKLIINFLYLLGRNTIARKFYYATH